jgi:methylmalonyl-CoA/ethylmalonyl-CoA epimerase
MLGVMHLIQVALRASDLDRAEGFYRRLLGQAPTGRFDPPGLLFFDLGGTRLLLEGNAPAAMLYLGVDDVRALVEELRPTVEVRAEPHLIFTHPDDRLGPAGTEEWQAFIVDSEGNLVGLVTQYPAG